MEVNESAALVGEPIGRKYKVRLIEGDRLGSKAYYPADVLKTYGPQVFVKGTPMFLNHQTAGEREDRPFGSIETFAAELAEDAYYENDGLYADIEVFEHQIPLIKSLKDRIGVSIRALVNTVPEVREGKTVKVVTELLAARSADFVVKAGAGGKIVSVLESAIEADEAPLEEMEENMSEEVLNALKSLEAKFDAIVLAQETATLEAEPVVEKVVDNEAVLTLAGTLAASTLDAEGRTRVLELHRANGKPIEDLIKAEEAYVKSAVQESAVLEETEESASEEVEEAYVPKVWKKN